MKLLPENSFDRCDLTRSSQVSLFLTDISVAVASHPSVRQWHGPNQGIQAGCTIHDQSRVSQQRHLQPADEIPTDDGQA